MLLLFQPELFRLILYNTLGSNSFSSNAERHISESQLETLVLYNFIDFRFTFLVFLLVF